jgi:hypothetical protein
MAISGNRSDYSELNGLTLVSSALDKVLTTKKPEEISDALAEISNIFDTNAAWTTRFNQENKDVIKKFNFEGFKLDLEDPNADISHNPAFVGSVIQLKMAVEERVATVNENLESQKQTCKKDLISFELSDFLGVAVSSPATTGDLLSFD